MTQRFINELLHVDSFKTILSEDSMNELSQDQNVYLIHSQAMYRVYGLYVNNETKMETRPRFFRKMGVYLYYERFTCTHGDEYYYYVKFREGSEFYKEHEAFIKMLILANDPSTLDDYTGSKDLTIYNKQLKENK